MKNGPNVENENSPNFGKEMTQRRIRDASLRSK